MKKARKCALGLGTAVLVIIDSILAVGWFVLLFDAISDFSKEKLPPLIAIPAGIAFSVPRIRRIWILFEITEIIRNEREKTE